MAGIFVAPAGPISCLPGWLAGVLNWWPWLVALTD